MSTHNAKNSSSPQKGGSGSVAAAAPSAAGASLSNTAPAISIPGEVTVLLTGIDSLYVSYKGILSEEWDRRLLERKEAAQSENPEDRLQAQAEIGGHLFVVHDRGSGAFAYVISDNWFRISLARPSAKALPVAYVQISSESLILEGMDHVLSDLGVILHSVAAIETGPNVSRADIRVDFVTSADLRAISAESWVARARDREQHFIGRTFSGWTIGLGGNVSARLYNKLLELEKSHKEYLRDIWTFCGWDGLAQVMRLEFQLERTALVEMGVRSVPDLLNQLPALWLYCTKDWLQLKTPSTSEATPTRWLDEPIWVDLSSAWMNPREIQPAVRSRKQCIPEDERIFVHGLGGITSFMASRSITDPAEGYLKYIAAARDFHSGPKSSLGRYVKKKVLDKGRRYNTIRTRTKTAEDHHHAAEAAEAYRRGEQG